MSKKKKGIALQFPFCKKETLIDFMVKKENIPKSTYSFQRLEQGAV